MRRLVRQTVRWIRDLWGPRCAVTQGRHDYRIIDVQAAPDWTADRHLVPHVREQCRQCHGERVVRF